MPRPFFLAMIVLRIKKLRESPGCIKPLTARTRWAKGGSQLPRMSYVSARAYKPTTAKTAGACVDKTLKVPSIFEQICLVYRLDLLTFLNGDILKGRGGPPQGAGI